MRRSSVVKEFDPNNFLLLTFLTNLSYQLAVFTVMNWLFFQLTIHYEDKPRSQHKLVYRSEDVEPAQMGRELLAALKYYFPDMGPSLPRLLQVQPDALLQEFPSLPSSQPDFPCHNFRRSYVTICDAIEQPFNEEVIWDVERIYFAHKTHEIRLDDFSHLALK